MRMGMLMKFPPKLKTLLPMTNGIFGHMDYDFDYDITKEQLDMLLKMYHGERNPSPVVDYVASDMGRELSDEELTTLAALLLAIYKPKWDRLAEIYKLDYDPIHNYLDQWEDVSDGTDDKLETDNMNRSDTLNTVLTTDMTRTNALKDSTDSKTTTANTRTDNLEQLETRDIKNDNTRTDNLEEKTIYGKSQLRTDNLSEVVDQDTKGSTSDSGTDSYFGFNSTAAVPVNSDTAAGTSSEELDKTTTNTGTQTTALTGTDTVGNTGTQKNEGTNTGTIKTENTGTQKDDGTSTTIGSVDHTGTIKDTGTKGTTGTNTRLTTGTVKNEGHDHRVRSGRHYGNIGNLTSQKQILEEIEVWKWTYINDVLNDAKDFLALPTYL